MDDKSISNNANKEPSSWRESLVPSLERPASYPHEPEDVRLIQTHISYVAIAPPFVYKLKKPVKLDFLDFSTLELRQHFCRREVELNTRLCTGVYLDVVTLVLRDGTLRFGEEREGDIVVDFAVKMRQLDERRFLSTQLEQNVADAGQIERIVNKLVPFYQNQDVPPDVLDNARPEQVRHRTTGNLDEVHNLVGDVVSAPTVAALRRYNQCFHEQQHALLARRPQQQRIRDCHGDLRPEHIHLGPEHLCIFDCIEFNDHFRHIDVAAEVAFLAMELEHAGRRDLAHHFVTRMAEDLDDPDLLRLLNFYKCYRAVVVAKVQAIRKDEEDVPRTQRDASREKATRYFRQALNYAVAGTRPVALAVMGRVATGKTTLAHALHDELGWSVFSSDRVRKDIAGVPSTERPATPVREELYDESMTRATYERLAEQATAHAKRGESVILDATYGARDRRQALRDQLADLDCTLVFVELQASDQVIQQRLRYRVEDTDVVSDARPEDYQQLTAYYQAPDKVEAQATLLALDGTQSTAEELSSVYTHLIEQNVAAC